MRTRTNLSPTIDYKTSKSVMKELLTEIGVEMDLDSVEDAIIFQRGNEPKTTQLTFVESEITETIMKWPETASFRIQTPFGKNDIEGEVICRCTDGSPAISYDGDTLHFKFDPFALHLNNLFEGFRKSRTSISKQLALSLYWSVPDFIRTRVRSIARKQKASGIKTLRDLRILGISSNVMIKLIEEVLKKTGAIKEKKRLAPAVLSHDIDTDYCQKDGRREVASVEADEKVAGVWFFVPKSVQYSLDNNAIVELLDEGHEIGMHGIVHDGKLKLDNLNQLVMKLKLGKKILDDLGADVISFRSPWALRSAVLPLALHYAGFKVDSSFPDTDTLGTTDGRSGIEYNRPYRPYSVIDGIFSVIPLLEIPMTGPQDVQIIEDISATEEQILEIWKTKAEFCKDFGGVFVHHTHPLHITKHLEAYAQVIRYLKSNAFHISTMKDIVSESNYQV